MIQFKKAALAVALTAGLFGGGAQAASLVSLTVTGGDFGMGAAAPAACNGGAFGSFQCVTPGNSPTITMGAYNAGSVTAFNFFGSPVTSFVAASATGAAPAFGANSGLPSGTVTGSAITVDLGGFFANWNGSNFLQGTDPTGANGTSTAATGTWTSTGATTGTFDITWHSFITTAPFANQTGYWHLTGTGVTAAAAPVPLPAAVWLLGSGLIGMVGVARRRKSGNTKAA